MPGLVRYKNYSRKEVHDIFSPDTIFTKGSGYWGISGIVKAPNTINDYLFFVTYGKKQADHIFDENIDENGILTWQSQPSQDLKNPRILDFINHDYRTSNIYLFLRTGQKDDYTYMGLLAYVDHDNQREKPVYFKWQILEWDEQKGKESVNDLKTVDHINESTNIDNRAFSLTLQHKDETYYTNSQRIGKNTKEFYNNKNINFEGEIKKNTDLGNKGEDIVVEYEKRFLILNGREDLAQKVTTTRAIAGNAERFDIFSYDEKGNEKYIEVKTTKSGLNNIFYISENEVKFSYEYPDNYYLYRVYNFNIKTMSADLKIIKGPIERDKLEPTNYTCRIGKISNT